MTRTNPAQNGFTLAEVLVALFIASLVVLGVNAAHRQMRMAWKEIENRRPCYDNTRILFDTLRTELAGLYVPESSEDPNQTLNGFELDLSHPGRMTMTFFTLMPCWNRDWRVAPPARVTYLFEKDPFKENTSTLRRLERACAGNRIIGTEETEQTLFSGHFEFRVTALDPNDAAPLPQEIASQTASTLPPSALRVKMVWFDEKQAQMADFETFLLIHCHAATPATGQTPSDPNT